MTTTAIGKEAEEAAADYLISQGFKIIDRNWKNRWCEIDIVAKREIKKSLLKRETIIHFVEVKFRKTAAYGSGLEHITQKKIQQLKKAALNWVSDNNWDGDYRIDAIEIDGETGQIEYIENAITA